MKIAIIGSGNMGSFYAKKWHDTGFEIIQIISPNLQHAGELAALYKCDFGADIEQLNPDAAVYFFAVKDDVLLQYARQINLQNKLVLHCAGSVALDELAGISSQIAGLWCVYSVNKNQLPLTDNIPLVVNVSTESILEIVNLLAHAISNNIFYLDEKQKRTLHLAAVFANNFTNHMFTISKMIADEQTIPFETLLPLISDTVNKLYHSSPEQNQTGPAIRHDEITMNKHLSMLHHENHKLIYRLISADIQKKSNQD